MADETVNVLNTLNLDEAIKACSTEVQKQITLGSIIPSIETATRKIGEVKYGRQYLSLTPINLDGAMALVSGVETNWTTVDEDGNQVTDSEGNELPGKFGRTASLVKLFNYAFDMSARQAEGNMIASAIVDPEKQLDKAAKDLAPVLGISFEEAKARIVAMKG